MNITNEKVTAYINGLYQPLNPFLESLRQEAENNAIPIILRETETLLLTLLEIKNPVRILEIGTAVGYSALCFAISKPSSYITTLELQERLVKTAAVNFEKAGVKDRIQIVQGEALDTLLKLEDKLKAKKLDPFDFVFIDGAKGHYLEMWDHCIKLCKPGAVIVSDNILFKAMTASDLYLDHRRNKTIVNRMRGYLRYITSLPGVVSTVLPVGDGVAISVIGEM